MVTLLAGAILDGARQEQTSFCDIRIPSLSPTNLEGSQYRAGERCSATAVDMLERRVRGNWSNVTRVITQTRLEDTILVRSVVHGAIQVVTVYLTYRTGNPAAGHYPSPSPHPNCPPKE